MQPPAGYQQLQPQPKSSSNGIVILAVIGGSLVIFGGILATLAIAGVRRYLSAAKQAEAMSSIGAIARSAASTYDTGDLAGTHVLCASASRPVPASLSDISGVKYMSSPGDWSVDAPSNAGFACLQFSMTSPQYYQYDYHRSGSASGGAPGDTFAATASGDLDGDKTFSTFTLEGRIDPGGGHVSIAPTPTIKNAGE